MDLLATTMMRIPVELFQDIVNHIEDGRTLTALALANKSLQFEAERALYDQITYLKTVAQHSNFLTTIIRNTRLARLVHTYYSQNVVHQHESPLWDLVQHGLKEMINLRSLAFRESTGQPSAVLLEGCTFQLHTLEWRCHSEGENLGRWLATQSTLKRLTLEWDTKAGPIPKEACPLLEELAGNRVALEVIMPGRKVVKASWVPDMEESSDPLGFALSEGLRRLHTLSFGAYFSRPKLDFILTDLISIEILHLVGHSPQERDDLKHIPKLRELVISHAGGGGRSSAPVEEQESWVEKLFAECPKLVLIDIINQCNELNRIWYYRWTRGSSPPAVVDMKAVMNGRFAI